MTNEEMIADLKQFIEATVSQQTTAFRDELRTDISSLEERITAKIDTSQQAIAETLTHAIEFIDTTEQV